MYDGFHCINLLKRKKLDFCFQEDRVEVLFPIPLLSETKNSGHYIYILYIYIP